MKKAILNFIFHKFFYLNWLTYNRSSANLMSKERHGIDHDSYVMEYPKGIK